MFDFAWSEIALIAVVALIAIGPKDMPVAIRTVTDMIKKARRMAAEFQTHVDEMVRDANLDEVRSQINEIRNFDVRGEIEKAVDADGSIRDTFASNPMDPTPLPNTTWSSTTPEGEVVASEPEVAELPPPVKQAPAQPQAPAFIPPNMLPPPIVAAEAPVSEPEQPPAFIPPSVVLEQRSRPSA